MRKRITGALLTLVMLLSLVPAMGTTAAAAETETHPKMVRWLEAGKEMCICYSYNGLAYPAYFSDEKPDITGSTPDEKWESLKKINSYLPDGHNERRTVVGWSYYDPDSGRFYHKGDVYAKTDFVYQAGTTDDTLTFIVDSNLSTANGLYTKAEDTGLKNLNIELRNGATLTINGGTWDRAGDYQTSAALDVTRTEKMSRQNDFNRDVLAYGNLTLTGSGTLKVNVPDEERVLYGICANNISIKDNVSLDIKTTGNKFTYSGAGENGDGVKSAAIFCYGYLNIDTTGTVNIVCQKAPSKPNVNNPNSYNALDWIGERIYLTNAQSVTLNVVKKEDTFVTGGRYRQEHYNAFVSKARTDGWTVTETADDASPFIVKMTRKAELKNLELNVGGNSYAKDAVIPDHVVSSDASNKLSVSFDAGPQWFTTYYLKNKINLNARVYIWKDSEFQSNFNIAQMTGGRTDGTLDFTLDVRNLTLEAGSTYRVYVSVSPTMNGEYLAESPLTAQWTFKATAEPVLKDITAVGLMQDFYLYTKDDDSTNEPNIKISGTDQPYTITDAGSWAAGSDSETYTRTVRLKANDGYKFTDSTKVTAVNADGAKPVDGVSKAFDSESGTLSVTITTYKRYTVKFLNGDGTSTGNAAQYIRKEYKATAPDWEAVPSGKVFVGWTTTQGGTVSLVPGDHTTAITGNTIYYAVLEDAPTYDIKLTKDVPERGTLDGVTSGIIIENTGSVSTGELTASFKINNSDNFKFTNFCYDPDDENATLTVTPGEDGKTLTIPSLEPGKKIRIHVELPDKSSTGGWTPGDYGCAVQVKNNESGEKAISGIVLIKTKLAKYIILTVNHNDTQISYPIGAAYVGDIVDLTADAPHEHETFTGWAADSDKVVFEDPTATTTKFVMPDIEGESPVTLVVTAKFAVATVNGIAITKMPTKTAYEAGENFDPAGIEVKLTYSDGTMEALPNNATLTYDPSTALTVGTTSVKVSYTDGTNTWDTYLPITVKKPNAQTYTVTYAPGEGTGSMDPDTATEGVSFTLPTTCTFTPPADKVFDKWDINGTKYAAGASVTISEATTVKADWKDIPAGTTTVNPPTAASPFTYDGSEKTGVATGSGYGLTGTDKAINAGTYTVIATLTASDSYWTDGTQQPKLIEWTINPANRDGKPGAPEMASRTTDSITLKAITAAGETVEYSMDGSYWQSSTTFTGLSSGTGYTFYARYAAKTNYNPSDASEGATFFTLSGGSSGTAYTVTVLGSKNGAVTADRKTASAGSTVTLTVSPDKGYTLETLTVLDKSGKEIKLTEKNGKYTFTMPASNVEVKAAFMDDNAMLNFFVDVKVGDYFYDAVLWAAEKGITGGTDATHFSPNGVCTRAQAVTFLWRAAGSPAPKSTAMPFTDVATGSYYEQAVLWAVENGITNGTSDTTFSPNLTCSRAQIVTFLWRSQKSPAAGSVNPFTDVSADAYYADAVLWAVKESVTSGTTATTFSPNADCTRAQIVTFIYRALAE